MSVAQRQPHSSKVPKDLGWTAKEAVGIGRLLCSFNSTGSGADCLLNGGQCVCRHSTGRGAGPEEDANRCQDDVDAR